MADQEIVLSKPNGAIVAQGHFEIDVERLKVVKDVIAKDATDVELQFFAEVCKRTGLDPFMKQIYCIKRGSGDDDDGGGQKKITIQTGIDGFRIIAERTGKYTGQLGPFWCGPDGKWLEAWLDAEYPPNACRIGILRKDFTQPLWVVAHYTEYVQMNRFKKPTRMWAKMPANQLAKCAEALGLRKAFPMELSGLYTNDEMAQADVSDEPDTGGHPKGTKEAADYVAQQRIAQLQQQQASAGNTGSIPPSSQGQKGQSTHRETGAEHPRKESAPSDLPPALVEELKQFRAADKYGRLRMFKDKRKDVEELTGADFAYREILGKHIPKEKWRDGEPHADGFATLGDSVRALTELWLYLAEVSRNLAEPAEEDGKMSAEDFVEGLEPEVTNASH